MIDITDLNHVTIIVRDVKAAEKFYCEVLGMEAIQLPPAFTHATSWYRKGNAEIHMVHVIDAAQTPGDPKLNIYGDKDHSRARHFAFAVQDMDQVVSELNRHGIPIILGPRPRGDGATQLFCYDPDKHLIEFHTLP
jgi:catechol 2,3-dioxygenase-like lactoylglutathione lyase family enzyme